MKIKLVIECNPEASEEEANILMRMFRDLAQVSAGYGRVKLTDSLRRISDYYAGVESIPNEE